MGLRGHPDMGQLANGGGGKIAGKCFWQGQIAAFNEWNAVIKACHQRCIQTRQPATRWHGRVVSAMPCREMAATKVPMHPFRAIKKAGYPAFVQMRVATLIRKRPASP